MKNNLDLNRLQTRIENVEMTKERIKELEQEYIVAGLVGLNFPKIKCVVPEQNDLERIRTNVCSTLQLQDINIIAIEHNLIITKSSNIYFYTECDKLSNDIDVDEIPIQEVDFRGY